MRHTRTIVVGLASVGACGVLAASAAAVTLGSATPALFPGVCLNGTVVVQEATDPAVQYVVPPGGGTITSWSIYHSSVTAGDALTFLVLRPAAGSYTVVGADPELLGGAGVNTFPLASPIAVKGGDRLGLYHPTPGATVCYGFGPSILAADTVVQGTITTAAVGSTLPVLSLLTPGGHLLPLSAELTPGQDVTVAGAATPAAITAGGVSSLGFTVGHDGSTSAPPITFTDTVPSGLTVITAVAGSGLCTTAGQAVTCTITGLGTGASVPVSIVVSAAAAGTYTDTAAVFSPLPDPDAASNTASAELTVSAVPGPVPPACKTVQLKGTTLTFAKRMIKALNCTVGTVSKKASRTVRKGLVISTTPGPGKTLTNGSTVKLVTSSGPPRKKTEKRRP